MSFNVPNIAQSRVNKWHEFREDFDKYVAGDWTVTSVGTTPTRALTNMDGGALLLTISAADDDSTFLQLAKEGFIFSATRSLLFRARFKVSDATQSDFVMGLQITDTSPLAVSDGIWFQKDDGDANLDFHVASASVQSDLTAFDTLANDTFVELAFHFSANKSKIAVYRDGVSKGSVAITNAPLTTRTLTVSFGLQNGEAVAKTMTVDYIECIQDRA